MTDVSTGFPSSNFPEAVLSLVKMDFPFLACPGLVASAADFDRLSGD